MDTGWVFDLKEGDIVETNVGLVYSKDKKETVIRVTACYITVGNTRYHRYSGKRVGYGHKEWDGYKRIVRKVSSEE